MIDDDDDDTRFPATMPAASVRFAHASALIIENERKTLLHKAHAQRKWKGEGGCGVLLLWTLLDRVYFRSQTQHAVEMGHVNKAAAVVF